MTRANAQLRRVLKQAKPKGKSRQRVAPVERRTYRGKVYASESEAVFRRCLDEGLIPFFQGVCVVDEQPTLKMREDVKYTADFCIHAGDKTHIVEVKGCKRNKLTGKPGAYWQTAARLRWKWAQQKFSDYVFSVWVWDRVEERFVKVEG